MIDEEMKKAKSKGFVVIYRIGTGLKASKVFDIYEEALEFTTSDDGAGENKAIIVGASSDCDVMQFRMVTEDHT